MASKKWVFLGTGGTIAGAAASADDNVGYTAAQVGIETLLAGVPGLAAADVVCEQVAQVDSKDMDFAIWAALAARVAHWVADETVQAVVLTHGTDTLEETAFFLHQLLRPRKPVVLTCAMRPATARTPDGPQNLLDAVAVAQDPQATGVLVVCAGTVHGAVDVQKVHTYRLDAFDSGDAGPVAYVEESRLRWLRQPEIAGGVAAEALRRIVQGAVWPRVEIVMSHAGAGVAVVDALLAPSQQALPLAGLVVAATGNGTVHWQLEAALRKAQAGGVRVLRATRCHGGQVLSGPAPAALPHAGGLSPVKARIQLMLELLECL
jgi:L-asparaginase